MQLCPAAPARLHLRPVSCRAKMAVLAGLSGVAFLLFLGGPDLVTSHEARVALPARTMASSGWPWAAARVRVPPAVLRPGVVRLAPDWDAPPIAVNPWLVPVLDGQIRLQKPPLPYWCAAIVFRIAGGFSEFAVRLVPGCLGMLATLLVFDLCGILYGSRAGWLAALIWVSTYAIPEEYRKAMADPYLAFFSLACIWAWIRAAEAFGTGAAKLPTDHSVNRSEPNDRMIPIHAVHPSTGVRRFASGISCLLLCFYVSFSLALLAKGPAVLAAILLPLAAYHVCFRRRIPSGRRIHLLGVAVMLCIALPWPLYVWKTVPHALELWRYESLGELADNTENARPWWFYLPQLFYLSLPWTALLIVGIGLNLSGLRERFIDWLRRRLLESDGAKPSAKGLKACGRKSGAEAGAGLFVGSASADAAGHEDGFNSLESVPSDGQGAHPPASAEADPTKRLSPVPNGHGDPRFFFPLLWYGSVVLFFSFVHLKKNQYLLPALPAQTLLIAQGLAWALAGARRMRFKGWAGGLIAFQAILAIGFVIALPILVFTGLHHGAHVAAGVVAALLLVVAFVPVRAMLRADGGSWVLAQAAVYVLAFAAFGRLYITPLEDQRSPRPVASELMALSRQPGRTLLTSRLPEEVAVYVPMNAAVREFATHVLVILDDQRGVRYRTRHALPTPALPMIGKFQGWVRGAWLSDIRRVPMKSAPGDARWKVYELTVERRGYARATYRTINHEDMKTLSEDWPTTQIRGENPKSEARNPKQIQKQEKRKIQRANPSDLFSMFPASSFGLVLEMHSANGNGSNSRANRMPEAGEPGSKAIVCSVKTVSY